MYNVPTGNGPTERDAIAHVRLILGAPEEVKPMKKIWIVSRDPTSRELCLTTDDDSQQQQEWEEQMARDPDTADRDIRKRTAHFAPNETKDDWSDDLLWALYCAIWDAEDEGYGRSAMTQDGLRKALEYHGLKLSWKDKP
jgi:hypothetical protein